MKILLEEYQYDATLVRDVLYGIDALQNVEGFVSLSYVGYFYNPHMHDCVFILPKVLMDEQGLLFGKYKPESVIYVEDCPLTEQERKFLYEFAVWIYRAIAVYQNDHKDSDIIYHKQISQVGHGRHRRANTLLDILLSLIQFQKDNRNYITFILKNLHSGLNKINWTRTIAHSTALIQNQEPIYLNPVNKKRQINFDEELLIVYYSILNYISKEYGFAVDIKVGFELITGKKFDSYLNGRGIIRLRQIKYKYFSDTALYLWQLCYDFFAHANNIITSAELKEYLLVKNFYVVFEAIIDELIGDKKDDLPPDFKEQKDGKLVDHLYTYAGLLQADEEQQTYYIGDSKYYKIGATLGDTSIYKQYTYARNIVQYNIDLWLDETKPNPNIAVRDEVTEGYNILPNFFISAAMEKGDFSYNHREITLTKTGRKNPEVKFQFKDRLFDRDTMLLSRYNVNFLFVLSLYARNKQAEKAVWREEVRAQFRKEIRNVLEKEYQFYPMRSRGVITQEYVKTHFHELLGKVFMPFENDDLMLALEGKTPTEEQLELLKKLQEDFVIQRNYHIGEEPNLPAPAFGKIGFQESVLIAYYKDSRHLKWILDKKKYNARTGSGFGSVPLQPQNLMASYILLHNNQDQRILKLDGKGPVIWSKQNLIDHGYPTTPSEDFYLMYNIVNDEIDENLSKCKFDLNHLKSYIGARKGITHTLTLAELSKMKV